MGCNQSLVGLRFQMADFKNRILAEWVPETPGIGASGNG